MKFYLLLFFTFLLSFQIAFSQTKKQDLQERKKQLEKQIKEFTELRFQQVKKQKSILNQIDEIDKKIKIQTELINLTNEQIEFLDEGIDKNSKGIDLLEKELSLLKKEYALIIEKMYNNRSPHRQLVFLLSSETFWQAYKRVQFLKQYTTFRKEQFIDIQEKNKQLKEKNNNLIDQKKQKEILIAENEKIQEQLAQEKKNRKNLIAVFRKKEKEYAQEIQKRKAQAQAIDKEIEKLIRLAIVEANAKKNKEKVDKKNTKVKKDIFELTPEGIELSSDFQKNKGNLIWPVQRGYKSRGFGPYSDPLYPDVKHNNNGVSIACPKNTEARSIFKGEVTAIIAIPGGNKAVQIRHGDFISTYYNLSEIYVSKGQNVQAKTLLGRIFTDSEGKTEMKFFLYKNITKLNPEHWIKEM